ncbi:MAG: hypothetical protein M3N07_08130 [Pseudomonadota bacterium]|nr:hypothetical protein [Pseudomonadota bacterium]
MRMSLKLAACAAAVALAAGCGENRGSDGLTAEERAKLDEHANRLDSGDVVDASPDSLVADDEWMQAETGQAAANGAAANNVAGNSQ